MTSKTWSPSLMNPSACARAEGPRRVFWGREIDQGIRMKHHWTLTKMLALMAAILLGGGAAAMLGYPQEVSEARLGAEWRCMSTAFFVTTCARRRLDSRGVPLHRLVSATLETT